MMRLTVAVVALMPSLALAQPLAQPWTGGSCAHGYTRTGSFCVPREGAQDAIPPERNLPARMDPQRQLLPAQRQSALSHCL
jgi:hypothetical protein